MCILFTHRWVSIQDGLSGDPQDMKELLDKLAQENQQIAQLEAQLQVSKHAYFIIYIYPLNVTLNKLKAQNSLKELILPVKVLLYLFFCCF